MDVYQAEPLVETRYRLAEGPVWDEREQALLFVDIKGGTVNRLDRASRALTSLDVSQNVGCFALCEGGGYVLGMAAGLYRYTAKGVLRRLDCLCTDPMTRFNDGKCDPQGRFWAGTADLYGLDQYRGGVLCCLADDAHCSVLAEGFSCANGLAFAGDTLYHIDSHRRRVDAYRVEEGPLCLADARVAFAIERAYGLPDGMTIDDEGMLWVAHWGGGFVGRYDPRTGALLARVNAPASQTSSCCFGGADMRTLFITSAAEGKPDEPHGGNVFAVRLPVSGAGSPRYRG